jgi:ubiquinone/menaquinone biosynthesis C-methylase UbiE
MTILKKYSPYALPTYLVKNYWWAYLAPMGVNFFDYGFMVNRILWGQYHKISHRAVELLLKNNNQKIAGISCAYGELFPLITEHSNLSQLYLFDVTPGQVTKMEAKVNNSKCQLFLGNAEQVPMIARSVDASVLFFLLHELPKRVRANVLFEAIRITKKSGRIVIADYGPITDTHIFHKNKMFAHIFERLEPFLADFWRSNLVNEIAQQAKSQGREVKVVSEQYYFNRFYRLLEFVIE